MWTVIIGIAIINIGLVALLARRNRDANGQVDRDPETGRFTPWE